MTMTIDTHRNISSDQAHIFFYVSFQKQLVFCYLKNRTTISQNVLIQIGNISLVLIFPMKPCSQKESGYSSQFKDDAIIPLIEAELKGMSPTQEQLLQITNQLKNIEFEIPKATLMKETKQADDLLQKNPGQNVNEIIKDLSNDRSKYRLKSRIIYGIGNIVTKEKKQKIHEKKQQEVHGIQKEVQEKEQQEDSESSSSKEEEEQDQRESEDMELRKVQKQQWKHMKIKELKPEQIEELVRYETIQLEIQKFTKDFNLKLREIKENTKNIGQLFDKCLSKNQKILEGESFLNLANGIEVARFAREGCNFDKRGIYIFLNYLVRTIRKMEENGFPIDSIEESVTLLIQTLSKLYPPGQGLEGQDQKHKGTLGKIEKQWDKQKQPLENNPVILFKDSKDKRKQLEQQTIERARIAGEELPLLNEIIRQNCLKKCIGVNSNLKLYAQTKNSKALIRITEKMLFKKKKYPKINPKNPQKSLNKQQESECEQNFQQEIKKMFDKETKKESENVSLKDYLEKQQKNYQDNVQDILEDEQCLEFTISDMVRGKCTFSKIEDIIETIENIKEYVKESHKTEPKKFRILEIESRFTKPIPISDITLKIALNQRIIAQLQLTLQNNVATYLFAHKIYELQRSKAFSKIKTVFNYYQEYRKEFEELVMSQLRISKSQKDEKSQKIAQSIRNFFEISGDYCNANLGNVLEKSQYQSKVLNQQQKLLVEAVFARKMQKLNKYRAPLFTKILINQSPDQSLYPETFRSAIFFQMIKDINIPENFNEICQQYGNLDEYLKKSFLKDTKTNFLNVRFLRTIRTQMKYQQLDQLFKMNQQSGRKYQSLLFRVYGKNQQMCEWMMKKGKMYDHLSKYQKAIKQYDKAIQMIGEKQSQLVRKIKLNKAIVLIKNNSFSDARDILSKIKDQYIEIQQHKNAAVCAFLLSETALMLDQYENFKKQQEKANQIATMHKINLGGFEIADSQFRIGESLLEKQPKEALDKYLRQAFEEYGQLMYPLTLIKKMEEHWEKYEKYQIKEPKLKANRTIKKISLDFQLFDDGIAPYLKKLQWPNLQQIDLYCEQSSFEMPEYLSNRKWSNLQFMGLYTYGLIGAEECSYLSKGQFPNLKQIELALNSIDAEACFFLSEAKWPNLQVIYLEENQIDAEGCRHLSNANWPKLQEIHLYDNKINGEGCLHLSNAKWPKLQIIHLYQNQIDSQGCLHLSNANWPELQRLTLNDNQIDIEGCLQLSNAKWPKLRELDVYANSIPTNATNQVKDKLNKAFPNAKIII